MVTLHMKLLPLLPLLFILFNSVWSATSNSAVETFLQCLTSDIKDNSSKIIITKHSSAYFSAVQSSIQNLRFVTSGTSRPEAIITPFHDSHVQAAVICTKKKGVLIRIRSGGHDYESQSYVARGPFVIIDLFNLRSIDVDIENESVWVESGYSWRVVLQNCRKKVRLMDFQQGHVLPWVWGDILVGVDLVPCSGSMVWQRTMSLMLKLSTLMTEFLTENPWEKNSFGLLEEGKVQALELFWHGNLGWFLSLHL
ncbi:tetrahydrocannabinolic acid synthase-like [Prunus yedoensis var. nudiflora]|uniref:Tetrahydrocannabinolic acid synthase-like n=1 Tax=Prunus yedoensis var. nudiflora TaxID=2094558 RepID=A0A314UR22_PRUYE|nr:tetrahydrocannabinolic acid synthase-like [Prunus yedoensis var. nudiflora]